MEKENSKEIKPMPLLILTIITGIVGGTVGTIFIYLAHYFHFTSISPAIIISPIPGAWKAGWIGVVVTIILYNLLSILAALFYYGVLRKKTSLYWGLAYGLAIYILLFIGLPAVIPGMKPFYKLDINTILTELCFFILYGMFIGYTISYEYNEQRYLKKINVKH
ncbi:YqhR family membrane protein [Bacillus sp. FSL K6-3431]|uniref:YqhR family membrane protein n=1 Tax=Bacillus sp. FSL K6-3431 TaxID=2921500 RepID=UPI0030F66E42